MHLTYQREPFPHIFATEFADPELYSRLDFPRHLIRPGEAWGLTSTDPEYELLLQDANWRKLHDQLRGDDFVRAVLDLFSQDLQEHDCLVQASNYHLTGFQESRQEKERASLQSQESPQDLFTRLDFQEKTGESYREFVHLDWPRRVVTGLFYFCDAREEGMVGGETGLFLDREFRNDRWCHAPELVSLVTPRHNTALLFLNTNASFHGPRAITALKGTRRWLYYTISSKADVWPTDQETRKTACAS